MNIEDKYSGLSDDEVIKSKEKYGINEIQKVKRENIFLKILMTFKEPMFLLLIVTANIYFVLGDFSDGIIMLLFVMFMFSIEFFQEYRTDKALESLKKLTDINVKVVRNGNTCIVSSSDVVVGDIVVLEEGDKVPADGIILYCHGLGVDEAILTGESSIVYKNNKKDDKNRFKTNMCYALSNVTNGMAIIKIVNVGDKTECGKIGLSLNQISKKKTVLHNQSKRLIIVFSLFSFLFFY